MATVHNTLIEVRDAAEGLKINVFLPPSVVEQLRTEDGAQVVAGELGSVTLAVDVPAGLTAQLYEVAELWINR